MPDGRTLVLRAVLDGRLYLAAPHEMGLRFCTLNRCTCVCVKLGSFPSVDLTLHNSLPSPRNHFSEGVASEGQPADDIVGSTTPQARPARGAALRLPRSTGSQTS